MTVRLTVLGCAGSIPAPDMACSSYLVEADGYGLLLDCGPGSAGRLSGVVAPAEIDLLLVSHTHSDHYNDLSQLWSMRARAGAGPLRVVCASDMPALVWENPDGFAATAATPGPLDAGPLAVSLARVDHGECWAVRVGDALCYTADTAPCAAIDALADGCRVLLAEASGLDAFGPLPGHLTAGDAARLAVRSSAALLILTHLRPWQDHRALLDEAASIATMPVLLAQPGLSLRC